MDERVRRFVQRHAQEPREAVRQDVAPYVDLSPEERGRHLAAACRLAAQAVLASPWRDQVLAWRDPPDPAWRALIQRPR